MKSTGVVTVHGGDTFIGQICEIHRRIQALKASGEDGLDLESDVLRTMPLDSLAYLRRDLLDELRQLDPSLPEDAFTVSFDQVEILREARSHSHREAGDSVLDTH